ncbi:MAG: EscU/YscU/HrcU family type III secretion system export apparatus switch protein, partial [Rhodospirillaceae bacterium]|nr:EscU/YscU/HrcU family type III secretion system export apparatus switch protein [Rhodospirillaceae bacterium]
DMVRKAFTLAIALIAPPVGIALAMGIFANFAQVGVLFAAEQVKPDLKKISPGKALKNIFSKKNLVELLKSLVKIAVLGVAVTHVVWTGMPTLIGVVNCGLECLTPVLGALFTELVIYVSLAFIVVAVADYAFQKLSFIKSMKMSKDEVKREYKESEGNPEMKSRRRSLFMEIVNSQETSNVRRSSVVVANPVHLAVGLYYEKDKTPLPVVTLKERGLNAQRVVAIAEREEIPVMIDVPLAHSLMSDAEVNRYIPDDMIGPVAEVLRLIRNL